MTTGVRCGDQRSQMMVFTGIAPLLLATHYSRGDQVERTMGVQDGRGLVCCICVDLVKSVLHIAKDRGRGIEVARAAAFPNFRERPPKLTRNEFPCRDAAEMLEIVGSSGICPSVQLSGALW